MNHICRILFAAAAVIALSVLSGLSAGDSLDRGFINPPDAARPRVWWHWTGGNITKEGITKDLEWMKRIGIGGAQVADIGMSGGQTIEKKIEFFTPEWLDAIRHAAAESDRLGLEMSIFSSSGWSLTGGPWIRPEQAMKKLVWSETNILGPTKLERKLPQPPAHTGSFGSLRGLSTDRSSSTDTYYSDSAVLAFRTPPDETLMEDLKPKVTTSGGDINPVQLTDDIVSTTATIAAGQDGIAWVQYEFPQPVGIKAVTLIAPGRGVPFGQIRISDDGRTFRAIVELPGAMQYRAGGPKTYAFPETTARFVRLIMTAAAPNPDAVIYQTAPKPARQYQIGEFIVHTGARVNRWQDKAGFNLIYAYEVVPTPSIPAESMIRPADVIDLTAKMDKDGTLHWDVPAGNWTVLRMGYSLVGSRNRAGTAPGLGLEVDKLNARHVTSYFHGYMDPIEKALGPLLGKSLRYMMMDSWEAGMQNWTDDMISQFEKRRGYDPTPYLPALAGRVVGSADLSDRFLWDFRRTIADLIAEAHYGTMAALLRQKGMGIYAEAPGVSMEILEDTLLTKSMVEIPMGEFWLGRMHPPAEYYVDVRMAASAAHIYGKKFVAAESFTGGGYDAPAAYKNLADYWFAQGVNRIVFHSSAHQPLDTRPGNTMVGTHFNRNITWAEQAKPVVTYLTRSSYMLQQGVFVADLAYLLNEGAPSSQPFWGAGLQPAPPEGYDYDTVNADALLNQMKVSEDGRIVLPDGMSYRILVLPQTGRMRPELLRKIRDLAAGGATIVGPKPVLSPSLQNGANNTDLEVQALADELWGDLDGAQRNKRYFGKGLVTWGLPLDEVLSLANIPKDAEFAGPLDSSVAWIHRRDGDADIYFVANRTDRSQEIQSRFRVNGKEAELWHPDTGVIEPAGYTIEDGRTVVPLHLDPRESVFVVFRRAAESPSRSMPLMPVTTLSTLSGSWDVSFPPNLGAPAKIQLANLESWTANSDDGVKYFSGTAIYAKTFKVEKDWLRPAARLVLDLGTVKDIAEISINSQPAATLWKPPFCADITKALRVGTNHLEIKITNQWTNRQIGDRLLDPKKRVLEPPPAGMVPFGGPQSLSDSGLIGPVRLLRKTAQQ
ncbi:MAG: glycoside hydrolase [Acidobacteria bacterium]|nr:glycoside hydrolase [Acidobacteriota bacterium]